MSRRHPEPEAPDIEYRKLILGLLIATFLISLAITGFSYVKRPAVDQPVNTSQSIELRRQYSQPSPQATAPASAQGNQSSQSDQTDQTEGAQAQTPNTQAQTPQQTQPQAAQPTSPVATTQQPAQTCTPPSGLLANLLAPLLNPDRC